MLSHIVKKLTSISLSDQAITKIVEILVHDLESLVVSATILSDWTDTASLNFCLSSAIGERGGLHEFSMRHVTAGECANSPQKPC
jgi:hypothetical protein